MTSKLPIGGGLATTVCRLKRTIVHRGSVDSDSHFVDIHKDKVESVKWAWSKKVSSAK